MEETNKLLNNIQQTIREAQMKVLEPTKLKQLDKDKEEPDRMNSIQLSEQGLILNSTDLDLREVISLAKSMIEDKSLRSYLDQLKEQARSKMRGVG